MASVSWTSSSSGRATWDAVQIGRVEAGLPHVHALHGSEPPRREEGCDPRRPRPLSHPVEQLPVADVVAVDELLVGEDVPVGVEDPLRQPGRPG